MHWLQSLELSSCDVEVTLRTRVHVEVGIRPVCGIIMSWSQTVFFCISYLLAIKKITAFILHFKFPSRDLAFKCPFLFSLLAIISSIDERIISNVLSLITCLCDRSSVLHLCFVIIGCSHTLYSIYLASSFKCDNCYHVH